MEPLLNRLRGRMNELIHSIFNSIPKPVDKVKNGYDYIIRGGKGVIFAADFSRHFRKKEMPFLVERSVRVDSINKHFCITEEQMDAFISDFYLGLPDYMQSALAKAA